MVEELSAFIDGREIEAFLNVIPIDSLFFSLCNDDYTFHFPVSKNMREVWLHAVPTERGNLFGVTFCQVLLDNFYDPFYGCGLPCHAAILPQGGIIGKCRSLLINWRGPDDPLVRANYP